MFIVLIIIALLALFSIRIVHQNHIGLVETFGKFSYQTNAGIHFIIPLFQRMRKVPLAIQPLKIPQYSVITKDNADALISVTMNYQIKDAQAYTYNNTNSEESLIQLVRGHLRDIIGRMTLDDALGSTAKINGELFQAIDKLTLRYGIVVIRVNIDTFDPSKEIQEAMNQQLTADRQRKAEISKAEGDATSIKLRTKAQNDALKETAKAQAQATKTTANAESYRITKIQSALNQTTDSYFRDRSISAFKEMAQGKNNLVVTSNDKVDSYGDLPVVGKLLKLKEEKETQN